MHSKHNSSIKSAVPPAPVLTPRLEHKFQALETEEEMIAKVAQRGPPVLRRQHAMVLSRGKGRRKERASLLPPEILDVSQTNQILRFVVLASPSSPITISYAEMLLAMGTIGTVTNSTVVSVHSTFRLHKVTVWPAENPSASANSLPEVEWLGGGTTEVARDHSFNKTIPAGCTAKPGPLVSRPSSFTLAGDWIYPAASSAQNILALHNLLQGSVIDINVSGTLRNNLSGITRTGMTTVTLGSMYWTYLDVAGSNKLQPVGRPTTT